MSKIILFLLLILLNGCSFNSFFLKGEIDKVTVVKYTAYMKHHRAYFSRDQLKVIKNAKKYLYLHNEKNNDLIVLLHRNNYYILYNLSQPKRKAFSLKANSDTSALKKFKRMGYKTISSPASKGFIVSVSHRRYKDVKTLLIEVKEYTDLQKLYENSIKTYDASKIKNIKTKLPKSLIIDYYIRHKKQATTHKQLTQLQIIAKKLQIKGPSLPSQNINTTKKEQKEVKEDPDKKEYAWYEFEEKGENKISSQVPYEKPYSYYLEDASINELSTYISKDTTKNSLSSSQYSALKQRKVVLQEEKLLREGSLEELITAYKVNKSPKYKERIMLLMKEEQK